MASAVNDLEAGLQAMLNLKPPGVSGSRITSLTSLCVSNVQSESVLIQKIYTHFKKTPGTHKLGVLYVVDSVTRKWLDQAKAQNQTINSSAPDGTYAAAVNRVTELMPVLMNDISQTAPDDQKEKIKKLLDIWDKGQTFPSDMLESFRQKLSTPSESKVSTTPPGSPPANALASFQGNPSSAPAPAAAPNGSSILEALANIARQNTSSAPAPSNLPPPAASYSMPPSSMPQPVASHVSQPPQAAHQAYPPAHQAVNAPSSLPFSLQQVLGQQAPPAQSNMPPQFPAAPAPGAGAIDNNTQQQIMLIKALADQGVPFDKIPALIQSLTSGAAQGGQPPAPAAQGSYPAAAQPWNAPGHNAVRDDGRDRGYQDNVRSPQHRYGGRSRSRSPDRGWNRGGDRNGQDYNRNSPRGGRHEDRERGGRRGNDYRQRSPPGRRGRSATPDAGFPHIERWVDYDPTLPKGTIRVLSRTLFVGGVTVPEAELRAVFAQFGIVQTCIVNKEKRHAFVKMLTRKEAEVAKKNMEGNRSTELPLRTRWGVGFGPRDCSDYATGISVIPITKLTEADRKWMLSAAYGGSGGRPIETGLCVEEPDIEIGAGVSSKAISRRMQTDKGGSHGPKSTRTQDDEPRGNNRGGWRDNRDDDYDNRRNGGNEQAQGGGGGGGGTGAFPFGIGTLPNGMPNFPPGFSFPDPGAGR